MQVLEPMEYIAHDREYFDTIYPWSRMRRIALAPNREVVGIHHPDNTDKWEDGSDVNWSEYESNGWNCMVQIPKFWYRSELGTVESKKTFRWFISDSPQEDFKIHPAFIRDGVEQDFQYLSAFEGSLISGKLRSLPNKTVSHTRTIVQFRSDAQANGEGFEQQEFLITSALQLLYSLEYGYFDSQTMIGEGRVSQSSYTNTGMSLSNGNHSFGNSQYMTYRGIENFWGNHWKFVDGININNRESFIADSNFVSDRFDDNYKSAGFVNVSFNGNVSDIGFSEFCDYGFLPIEISGNNSSHLHDNYWQSSGNRVVRAGGSQSDQLRAGVFCWACDASSGSSHSSSSARLGCILG